MSATLRVEDFTGNPNLFNKALGPPPVIKVESRQFETTCHFQKVTPDDYLALALKKTAKIHKELPEGGILVFVTGQGEVNHMVKRLRKAFPARATSGDLDLDLGGEDEEVETVEKNIAKALKAKKKAARKKGLLGKNGAMPRVDLDKYNALPLDDTEADALIDMEQDADLSEGDDDDDSLNLQVIFWNLDYYLSSQFNHHPSRTFV